MNSHTADLSDVFFALLDALCVRLECAPLDMLGCWFNESRLASTAQNANGWASGIFQAMPQTLRGLGYRGDAHYTEPIAEYNAHARVLQASTSTPEEKKAAHFVMAQLDRSLSDAFARMLPERQLPWAERYYGPHRGLLVSRTACYMATFCPAWLSRADEPNWVICSAAGPCDSGMPPERSVVWFRANASLDVNEDGKVTPGDLGLAIARATQGARWEEVARRATAARASA